MAIPLTRLGGGGTYALLDQSTPNKPLPALMRMTRIMMMMMVMMVVVVVVVVR